MQQSSAFRKPFKRFLRRWVFSVVGVASLIILGVLILGCYLFISAPGLCGNTVLQEIPSPDGKLKAVIFERDCGATTDFSTQISIMKANKDLRDEAGNIFIADSNHQKLLGLFNVEAKWLSSQELQVAYPQGARVFRKESGVAGVVIRYRSEE